MRVNLGSGEYPQDGWTNVDSYAGVTPDVVADAADLPFGDASVDAVYAGHCLEHNDPSELPAILTEIRRVLKPGGLLCVVAPDLDRIDPVQRPVLYGMADKGDDTSPAGDNPRGIHRWGCTEAALLAHIRAVFPEAQPVPIESLQDGPWPVVAYADWQCAVTATREDKPVTAKVVTPPAKRTPRTTATAQTKKATTKTTPGTPSGDAA